MALSRSMKNFMQSHIAKAPNSAFGQATRQTNPAQRVGNQRRSAPKVQGSFDQGVGQVVNQAVNKRGILNAPKIDPSFANQQSNRPAVSKRGMGSGPKIAPPTVQPTRQPVKNSGVGSGPKIQGTFGFLGQTPQRTTPDRYGQARPAMGFRGMRRR